MITSVTVMHEAPSERAFRATTVDFPETPGLVSLVQAELVPTPPRVASFVAVAAWTCSRQLSWLMIASDSSEPTGIETPATEVGTPARPSAALAIPPAILPNMPPPPLFRGFSHFLPILVSGRSAAAAGGGAASMSKGAAARRKRYISLTPCVACDTKDGRAGGQSRGTA